ncbi:MAG: lysozyme inhibitor LprI family protein [Terricaulis sp.]
MRQLVFAFALFAAACASPGARADDDAINYTPLVQQCVTAAATDEALAACKGAAWTPCSEADGGSTYGMLMCYSSEADGWEAVIASTVQSLSAAFPDSAATIANAQSDWRSLRENDCVFARQRWGPGSGAQVEYVRCMAAMGADRGITLQRALRHPD